MEPYGIYTSRKTSGIEACISLKLAEESISFVQKGIGTETGAYPLFLFILFNGISTVDSPFLSD
jgi:hypothetical protein